METIKSNDLKLNGKKIEGYLVRYTNAAKPDLMKDYFTKDTNFGGVTEVPLFYDHGFNEFIDREQIGMASITYKSDGIYISASLELKNPEQFLIAEQERRKAYLSVIEELAGKSMLGWSSGAVGHLVKRVKEPMSDVYKITQWILGEASLTPSPAEPDNNAFIKSIEVKYLGDYLKKGAKVSAERLQKMKEAHAAMAGAQAAMAEALSGLMDEEEKSINPFEEIKAQLEEMQAQLEEMKDNNEALNEDVKSILAFTGVVKSEIKKEKEVDYKSIINNIVKELK